MSSEDYGNGSLLVDGILQHNGGGVARTTVPVQKNEEEAILVGWLTMIANELAN